MSAKRSKPRSAERERPLRGRADLARFMLDQLETDENRGHAVAVAY